MTAITRLNSVSVKTFACFTNEPHERLRFPAFRYVASREEGRALGLQMGSRCKIKASAASAGQMSENVHFVTFPFFAGETLVM
jgi:hypothetical protein